jgi:hypothetical protein
LRLYTIDNSILDFRNKFSVLVKPLLVFEYIRVVRERLRSYTVTTFLDQFGFAKIEEL